MNRTTRHTSAALALMLSGALALAGCGGSSSSSGAGSQAASAANGPSSQQLVADLSTSQDLHQRLPAKVRESGTLKSVIPGPFPPYTIPKAGGAQFTGATIDLGKALGKVLGVQVQHQAVEGLTGVLTGLSSGRYDLALGPIGDYTDRRGSATFVDWVQEYVAFLVPAGNPNDINGLGDTCGLRIGVEAGGSAEQVIREQSKTCTQQGEKPVTVQAFNDQPSSVLAVQAGRSDAFFSSQAPLTYFEQQATSDMELTAQGQPNGFDPIRQGSVLPKGSPMVDVILDAYKELYSTGVYDKIMKKWGLQAEMLPQPGVNLGHGHS